MNILSKIRAKLKVPVPKKKMFFLVTQKDSELIVESSNTNSSLLYAAMDFDKPQSVMSEEEYKFWIQNH